MPPNTKPKRETWADWMSNALPTMELDEFLGHVNARLNTGRVLAEDLEAWQDDGILPYPVEIPGDPGNRALYPPDAWLVIRDLMHEERDRGIHDRDDASQRDYLRQVAKGTATVINNSMERTANSQSWRDFMPSDSPMPEVLSRDELLEALRDRGIEISPYTLEHYRRNGVLPRPVRQRHGGVTQPVYPVWFIPAIEHLKQLQAEGKSLEEIKPWMRSWALSTVQWGDPLAKPTAAARASLTELLQAHNLNAGGVLRVAFVDDNGVTRFEEEWPVTPEMLSVKT